MFYKNKKKKKDDHISLLIANNKYIKWRKK